MEWKPLNGYFGKHFADPDAFHQGLQCLLKQNQSSEKENLGIITCVPSIYTVDHPDLTVLSFMENSIGLNGVNFVSAAHWIDLSLIILTNSSGPVFYLRVKG